MPLFKTDKPVYEKIKEKGERINTVLYREEKAAQQ
jgi:hypothetical protein